jgi:hypothetical protein
LGEYIDDLLHAKLRCLLTDAMTAEVVAAFEQIGVPAVLLKGPVIAEWLYAGRPEERPYGDADLLVAGEDEARAAGVLRQLGFHREFGEVGHPGIEPQNWLRAAHEAVDLHTTLWGVGASPQALWSAFSANTRKQRVGGRSLTVTGPVARALQLTLHAAQHAGAKRTLRDLDRAIEMLPLDCWREVADLAADLDAAEAFGAGLGLTDAGRALALLLGVPTDRSRQARLRMAREPMAEGIEQLARTPGFRARALLLRRELFPSPDFMRWRSGLARRGALGLMLSYPARLLWMASRAPAAYAAWRRATREPDRV